MSNLRYAYLIKVDATKNNNKFYEMIERDDGMIELYNGRVESSRVAQKPKPSSNWDKIHRSKIKKQYQDMTEFRSVKVDKQTKTKFKDVSDSKVSSIINTLQSFAGQSVSTNYSVKSVDVTQKMVDEAQSVVNEITKKIKKKTDISFLNDKLQYLFSVIPRKMTKVQNHLFDPLSDKDAVNAAREIMQGEQDTLDSMAGQVIQNSGVTQTIQTDSSNKNVTILDSLGIEMVQAIPKEIEEIQSKMFDYDGRTKRGKEVINVFKVINKATEEAFQANLKAVKNKHTMLMYHGSRNQNWMYILPQGLRIRPSNSVHNGSMFDDGVYGADADAVTTPIGNPNPGYAKAYGYTSSSRAYWSGGNSKDNVFMAIMEFHVGNQKHIYTHDSSCYTLASQLKGSKYNSVYAHGNRDGGKSGSLQNSEFIVYNSNQITIRYLLELKS